MATAAKKILYNGSEEVVTKYAINDTKGRNIAESIDNLKSLGRFLSVWNASTGLPETNPPGEPPYSYTYVTGDYFIVGVVDNQGLYPEYMPSATYHKGDRVSHSNKYYICSSNSAVTGTWDASKWSEHELVNFKPSGGQYTGAASSTVEANALKANDFYRYDGQGSWILISTTPKSVYFSEIAGNAIDNDSLRNTFAKRVMSNGEAITGNNDGTNVNVVTFDTQGNQIEIGNTSMNTEIYGASVNVNGGLLVDNEEVATKDYIGDNFVTKGTAQEITASKTFKGASIIFKDVNGSGNSTISEDLGGNELDITNAGTGTSIKINSGSIFLNGTAYLGSSETDANKIAKKDEVDAKATKASNLTGATKTKITYNSDGIVTAGDNLSASDIPSLSADKITSGTFSDARIASASTWNNKVSKSGNEEVNGIKTFTSEVQLSGGANLLDNSLYLSQSSNSGISAGSNDGDVKIFGEGNIYLDTTGGHIYKGIGTGAKEIALVDDIPTNNNQLTNGAGYITNAALSGYATQTWVGNQGYVTATALKQENREITGDWTFKDANIYAINGGTIFYGGTDDAHIVAVKGDLKFSVAAQDVPIGE